MQNSYYQYNNQYYSVPVQQLQVPSVLQTIDSTNYIQSIKQIQEKYPINLSFGGYITNNISINIFRTCVL